MNLYDEDCGENIKGRNRLIDKKYFTLAFKSILNKLYIMKCSLLNLKVINLTLYNLNITNIT